MQLYGLIGYECDLCGCKHLCDTLCDNSALPEGWSVHERYQIYTCDDCDIDAAIKHVMEEE